MSISVYLSVNADKRAFAKARLPLFGTSFVLVVTGFFVVVVRVDALLSGGGGGGGGGVNFLSVGSSVNVTSQRTFSSKCPNVFASKQAGTT